MTYSDLIEFYEDSNKVLKKLSACNQLSFIEIESLTPKCPKNIFQEMIDSGAAKDDNGDFTLHKNKADEMLMRNYYERKILDLQLQKKKDDREERMTKSTEKAQCIAIWSTIATSISAISAFIALLCELCSR